MIGYLVRDRIDDYQIFQGWAWAEDFRPDGTFVMIDDYPDEGHSLERSKEFTRKAVFIYDELRKRGFKDILMAMTQYSDAFDDFELKYLDREVNPASHNDWLALDKMHAENFIMEKKFYDNYRTTKARIKGIFKRRKDRAEIETKAILAVARIRSGLEDVSGG